MSRFVRILAALGAAALVAFVIRRVLQGNKPTEPPTAPWDEIRPDRAAAPEAAPATSTPPTAATAPSTKAEPTTADTSESDGADATDPNPDGSCPASFPVKAKLSSKIFHVPGGGSYERTKADRCYLNEAAAEADGLRQAKR